MSDFYHITGISELHNLFGLAKPVHPLIAIIREWPKTDINFNDIKLTSGLYLLSMKGKIKGNSFQYGKNTYDFEEGTLVSLAPDQVVSFTTPIEELDDTG
jgi:AraC family transcriptional activator of pobA